MTQSPRSFDQFAKDRVVHMRAQRARAHDRRTSPRQAYEQLRSAIGVRGWDGAGKLSEQQLVIDLGLTRNSVRAALQHLASEGLITRQTRNGTQVALQLVQIPVDEEHPRPVVGSAEQPQVVSLAFRQAVLDDLDAMDDLTDAYTGAERALIIERDLTIGTETIGWQLTVIPLHDSAGEGGEGDDRPDHEARLAGELAGQAEATPLGTAFLQAFDRDLGSASSTVQARACTPEMAGRLGVPVGAPLLFRELVLRDDEGVVRRISYSHYLGDRVAFARHF